MITDPIFYVAAVPAIILLGLSKGGLGSIGMLSVPMIALVVSPVQAAGITLPILVFSDIIALISYRGLFDRRTLRIMMPGAMAGTALGWATAAWVTEDVVRLIVGIVAVAFTLQHWLRGRRRTEPATHNARAASFWGAVTGFTSFVSHAGGPPYQMYVVPLRMSPAEFAGTAVVFFAIVNAVKIVPYALLGQFDRANLVTAAVLLPVALVSTLAGIWLVKRIDAVRFYRIVYNLIFAVGVFLVAQAIWNLAA